MRIHTIPHIHLNVHQNYVEKLSEKYMSTEHGLSNFKPKIQADHVHEK